MAADQNKLKNGIRGQNGAGEDSEGATERLSNTRPRSNHPRTPTRRQAIQPSLLKPPDGGWGWMVVVSSFMISVFVDGVCFSVGIFFNAFRDSFHSTKADTAWVGSVLNGTYLSIGPVVAACVHRFGCRRVAIGGAVFASISLFLSTFSSSLPFLILTYGFLTGIGFGFMYLPAMIMVGFYFEKRRALATGIACCGSGIGAFLFAPLCNLLLELYTWSGAVWILSAIVLNGVIFGVFYRPLQPGTAPTNLDIPVEENGLLAEEQMESLLKEKSKDDQNFASMVTDDKDPAVGPFPSMGGDVDRITITDDARLSSLGRGGNGQDNVSPEYEGEIVVEVIDVDKAGSQSCEDALQGGGLAVNHLIKTITPKVNILRSDDSKTFMSDVNLQKGNSHGLARMAFSHDILAPSGVEKRHSQRLHTDHHHHRRNHSHNYLEVDNPLRRRDIFYSGSLSRIPEFQSSNSLADYRQRVTKLEVVDNTTDDDDDYDEGYDAARPKKSCLRRVVLDPLLHVFDVTLLRSPTFDMFTLACFISMLGFFVPFIYLPTLCTDLGMGPTKAAFLISIIGIANTVGRVAVGFVSDQPWADCLLINNVALLIGGVSTCAVPFLKIYPLFGVYTFVFGSCIAVCVSLRTIIIVELMGVDKLTNTFGLVIMFQGIATFIGAPIAGLLSDITGDYNVSFYVAGIFFALGGVICSPLRRVARWEQERHLKKNDEAYTLSPLQKDTLN